MSNKEVIDNVKSAIKPLFERINTNELFSLDEMIAPKLITILYWLLLFLAIGSGFGAIFEGDVFYGLFLMASISIGGRIACELMIVIFRINETLHEMNKREKGSSPVSVVVSPTGDIQQSSGEDENE
jgi:Na+/H+-translocating membrane pyrophosphatase